MKDTACQDTLNLSLRWLTGAYFFWSLPIVYTLLTISPVLFGYSASAPTLSLFIKSYTLFGIIICVKYLTLTIFPDACWSSDEIRKLFTSANPFHALIAINLLVYPMLYRELGLSLAYIRNFDSWSTFQAAGLGLISAITYIACHEQVNYWYDPPFSRLHWLAHRIPLIIIRSLGFNFINIVIMSLIWGLTHLTVSYDYGFWYFYQDFAIGVIIYSIDWTCAAMLKNFLAKSTPLDDENAIGEQLAISGLTTNDSSIHFQCFQDLLLVSRHNHERRLTIFDRKTSQWKILLDKGIDYISAVSRHVRTYSVKKSKIRPSEVSSGMPAMQYYIVKLAYYVYYIFNEPFEVKFRNDLFKIFTMASLSSNVLTNFVVCSGMQTHILKDNSLSLILQAQVEALQDLEDYKSHDPEIDSGLFESNIKKNISDIRKEYKECLGSLSIRSDALGFIQNISD